MTKPKNESEQSVQAICYRHLPQDGYDNAYELINEPGNLMIKEQIIKGGLGYPNMYIRHLSLGLVNGKEILVISYTDHELTQQQKSKILAGALKFLNNILNNN